VAADRPAFYALAPGGLRDWWTLLHPPYTAWHLSYATIGAALAPSFSLARLGYLLAAFFLAVGIAAHALDELHGRPLRTGIPSPALAAAAVVSLAGALALGALAAVRWEPWLWPCLALGALLVVAYNLELFGGRAHGEWTFALGWGAFPLLTAYLATAGTIRGEAVAAAAFAAATSLAQRRLSTQARRIRRRVARIDGVLVEQDGRTEPLAAATLVAPAEAALKALAAGVCALALALVLLRLA
jgi:hypothetical protein